MPKPKVDPDLARGLNFTPEDLAANRQGYMSQRQRIRLQKRREAQETRRKRTFIVSVVGTLICAAGVLFTLITIATHSPTNVESMAMLLFILAAPMAGMGGIAFFVYYDMKSQIPIKDKGVVKSIQGKVILDTKYQPVGAGGVAVSYWLLIGDKTFEVNKQAYLRFKHLDYYTLYYAPQTRTILSAEPMEEN